MAREWGGYPTLSISRGDAHIGPFGLTRSDK
jgi:hypothetical protein